ncbi:MAG: hypothetical protein PHN56_02640 [Candidatus Nanoarchaeia archaeon]|nr:hypothetical protein [Candidatus Nanoarchaeia archaeon]
MLTTSIKNNKNINKKIKDISNIFESKYKSILPNWNGDQSVFKEFDEYLKKK